MNRRHVTDRDCGDSLDEDDEEDREDSETETEEEEGLVVVEDEQDECD